MNLIDEPKVVEGVKEFQDGDFMRGLVLDDYLCELYQLHGFQSDSHYRVGCRLWDGNDLIFDVRWIGIPRGVVIDSPRVFVAALSSLSMKPGDTESDYFSDYTPEQLYWVGQNADSLDSYKMCVEEQLDSVWNNDIPSWACSTYIDNEHEWLNCQDCQYNWEKQFEWEQYHGLELWCGDASTIVEVSLPAVFKISMARSEELKQFPEAQEQLVQALRLQLQHLLTMGNTDFCNLVDWDAVKVTVPTVVVAKQAKVKSRAEQIIEHDEEGNELLRLSSVSRKFGAPLGRRRICDDMEATVLLFRVQFEDGDYDFGGAYWGGGTTPLYCGIGEGFRVFVRATDRTAARAQLQEAYPDLKFKE